MTVLRRYLPVVIVCTILGAAIAAAFSWTRSDQYLSTTRLFFTTSSSDITDLYQATLAGQARVQTYKVLASDSKVLENAIAKTGVPLSRNELADNLHVDVPPGTIIMDIGVTDPDPGAAAQLANAVSGGLITLVTELERPLGGGPPPVALTVVQPAIPATSAESRLSPLWIGIGGAAGLAVGIIAAFVINGVRSRRGEFDDDSAEDDDHDSVDHGASTMSIPGVDR